MLHRTVATAANHNSKNKEVYRPFVKTTASYRRPHHTVEYVQIEQCSLLHAAIHIIHLTLKTFRFLLFRWLSVCSFCECHQVIPQYRLNLPRQPPLLFVTGKEVEKRSTRKKNLKNGDGGPMLSQHLWVWQNMEGNMSNKWLEVLGHGVIV